MNSQGETFEQVWARWWAELDAASRFPKLLNQQDRDPRTAFLFAEEQPFRDQFRQMETAALAAAGFRTRLWMIDRKRQKSAALDTD